MDFKKFESELGWFNMMIPCSWAEYEDDAGTYAFFDPVNWKGNFRITPLKFSDNNNLDDEIKGKKIVHSQIEKKPNSIKAKLGKHECAYSKEYIKNSKEETSAIYFWMLSSNNYLFTCSFTVNSDMELLPEIAEEIKLVEKTIASITTI